MSEEIVRKPVIDSPMWYGKHCVIELPNGKKYERAVRYNAIDGLYVVIATRKYRERDVEVRAPQSGKQ